MNLHTVESKFSRNSLRITFYFILVLVLVLLLVPSLWICDDFDSWQKLGGWYRSFEVFYKYKSNCGCEFPHSREQNFFGLNLRMSNNFYVSTSSIQFFDHEMSPSSFVFLYVLVDLLWEFWGWNSNQIWNCGCESPHSIENKISLNSIYDYPSIFISWLLLVQFLIMKSLHLLSCCSTFSLTFFVNFGAEIQIKCETVGVNLRTVKKANFSWNSFYSRLLVSLLCLLMWSFFMSFFQFLFCYFLISCESFFLSIVINLSV